MNRSHKVLYPVVLATILVHCTLLQTSLRANPYDSIGERNVFGLKDPPPPELPVTEKEAEPPPNIKVTGITTLQNIPRALLKVQIPAKPPTPAQEKAYILVAGGLGKDGIEVLEIDESHGKDKEVMVKVRYGGEENWLGLVKDTAKAAAAPPPGAVPPPGAITQTPAQRLAAARLAAAGGGTMNASGGQITREMRTGQPGMPGMPGYGTGTAGGLAMGGNRQSPVFQARDQVGNLSPEEQIILIEANRLNTINEQAAGLVPPPPATELTPAELNPTEALPQDPLNPMMPGFPQ